MQKTEFINPYGFVHFSRVEYYAKLQMYYLSGSFEMNNTKTIFIEFEYYVN